MTDHNQNTLQTLHTRALELAKKPKRAPKDLLEILEFKIMGERYGMALGGIGEVLLLKGLTPVPCTPAHVLGIINIRGRILSVLDLCRLFGLPTRSPEEGDKIITIKNQTMEFGFLVQTVVGTKSIPTQSLQVSLPTINGPRGEYLWGVTDDLMALLDWEKLLRDEKLIVNEKINILKKEK